MSGVLARFDREIAAPEDGGCVSRLFPSAAALDSSSSYSVSISIAMHHVSDHLCDRHPYRDAGFLESYDCKEVRRAFGARAVPKYAELLVMDDLSDDDRVRALIELHELLSNQERKDIAVSSCDLVLACAGLMDAKVLDVREHAARVLAALVLQVSDHFDELSTEPMLRATTLLLQDAEEDAVVAACAVLQNVTLAPEGAMLVASRPETVTILTDLLTSKPLPMLSERVLGSVLQVLANVTSVDSGANICMEHGITHAVLTVLQKCVLFDAALVLSAATILRNAAVHDHGKRLAIQEDGVEIALRVLTKVQQASSSSSSSSTFQHCPRELHEQLLRCLVGAIMALSTVEAAKPRVIEVGVEPLVACLHDPQLAVRENAAIAIRSVCEAPHGTAAFVAKLLPECALLVELLGVSSLPVLLPYLRGMDDDATLAALQVVSALVLEQEAEASAAIVQSLDLLDALVELLADRDGGMDRDRGFVERMRAVLVPMLQRLARQSEGMARRVSKSMQRSAVSAADRAAILPPQ